MNEERLNAFEKMLSDILARYDSVTEKLAVLKAEGQREGRYLSSAFYKQTTISNDIVVLPDIRSFG